MIVVNPNTRQFNIPGSDLIFGVVADSGSEVKYFQCPRYVGNNLDIMACFVRVNYRNANGETDSYLVNDLTLDGDNVNFNWELAPKVTAYKGQVKFVMCAVGPDLKVKWHTTLGTGQVHDGLEPDQSHVEDETADVVAQLIAMVEAQTAEVESVGKKWVADVKSEGATQVQAVKTASETAQASAVAEIEAKGVNTRNSIPDDYTAMQSAVDALTRGRAGAIVCEAAGSAVTVNDASDLPMQGLRIFGRSTQDGTPTPDAPVEIKSVVEPVVTVAGKNLIPWPYADGTSKEMNGITFTVQNDGSVLVNGTATALAYFSFSYTSGQHPLPQGWLCVSSGLGYGGDVQVQNDIYVDGEYSTAVQTVLENAAKRQFTGGKITLGASRIKVNSGATVSNVVVYPMLCCGETVQPYEKSKARQTISIPHTLPGIPVASGGNYTDSDGQQWIADYKDYSRGVYVQRIGVKVFDGSDDEIWYDELVLPTTVMFRIGILDSVNVGNVVGKDFVCTHFPVKNMYNSDVTGVQHTMQQFYFRLPKSVLTTEDLTGFKEFLNGSPMTVNYVLRTPIETPLSETELAAYRALHSNYPNTTILNDSGAHMVVKYAADTKLYIDNKITALLGG